MAKDKKPLNSTPTLSVFLANAFDGWYVGGVVQDGKFVVSRKSVQQFSDAQSRLSILNNQLQPLWLETWQITEIVLGD